MSPVWIVGAGAVGPLGLGFPDPLPEPSPDRAPRRVPPGMPLKEGFAPQAVRWLDNSSLWWVNACRQALSGLDEPGREATAQVVGLGWGSTPPVEALIRTACTEGFASMNPAQFPYSVGNAPAAQAGLLLKAKGPAVTLTAKEPAGLSALVEACRFLKSGTFGSCLAGGVDEMDPFLWRIVRPLKARRALPSGEGAYALLLKASEVPPERAWARVAAWCSPGEPCVAHRFPEPGDLLGRALGLLLSKTGWSAASVDLAALPGESPALSASSEGFRFARLPSARALEFQGPLGVCGASWAGAAGLAARCVAAGSSRRAVLLAVATGGAGWGVALEGAGAQ
jgi:hypothetical protein